MTSIELPEPVITWEVEETRDFARRYVSTFIVRAMVGQIAVFERRFQDDDEIAGDPGYAYDLSDAKEKAALALGQKLQWLFSKDENVEHYAALEANEMRETYGG